MSQPDYPELDEILIKFHKGCLPEGVDGTAALHEAISAIQALMIRERLDELRSLLNHCLEAFEPNSQGYALTVPELEERIEHLSASAGKKS